MSEQEIVKVSTWILCLCDENTDLPTFYYNNKNDAFQRNFNTDCAFLEEKMCLEKQNALNVDGVQMVKGTMDYPKELLVDIITEVFSETGLI